MIRLLLFIFGFLIPFNRVNIIFFLMWIFAPMAQGKGTLSSGCTEWSQAEMRMIFNWSQQNSSLAFLRGEPRTVFELFVPPELVCHCAVLRWDVSSDLPLKRPRMQLEFETSPAKYPVILQELLHQSHHIPPTPKTWCARFFLLLVKIHSICKFLWRD